MKKRAGVILCLVFMMIFVSVPLAFAGQGALKLDDTYPRNGDKGTAVENASVKLYFNEDVVPKNKTVRTANEKAFKLVDEKGKAVPIQVLYSHKEKGMMMVLSETATGANNVIKGDTKYTLTIDSGFEAAGGDTLGKTQRISFTTLNQSRTMKVNMAMMAVMMVGMIFFSSRAMRKQQEKERAQKGKTETVNPYKEAKRTGKSVEEIVEKDRKNKEKQAAAKAKRDAKRKQELEAEKAEKEVQRKSGNMRVSGPRPISAAGSTYKTGRKAEAEARKAKNTTRPKNQTGKQKNSKKK